MALVRLFASCLMLLCVVGLSRRASAQEVVQPWERLGAGLQEIYGWPNVLFHASAVAITPPLVYLADEPLQMEMRNDPFGAELGWGAFTIGGVTPVIVPATLYFGGLVMDRSEVATAGAALIQAEMVQLVVVSSLKWLTDRAGPLADHRMDNPRFGDLFRDSKDADDFNFNPFDLEWGLRWPSGHTASNFTLVSTLYAFYPNEHWIALLGYPFAMAVGIGMVEGDYHWFSDIVAGALIGHVIGWSIGEQFREEYDARRRTSDKRKRPAVKVQLLPTPHGLRLIGTF